MKKFSPLRFKNLSVDMTAMCDVAFLLLCFFVLTTRYEQWEPMKITPPVITQRIFDGDGENLGIIYIADNRVMYQIVGDSIRKITLEQMGQMYHVKFSPDEKDAFMNAPIIGAPISQLKQYDARYLEWEKPVKWSGIPYDSVSNELFNWVRESRKAQKVFNNKALPIMIKADKNVGYPMIKQVIAILQKQRVNKFELLTDTKRNDNQIQ